MTDPTQDEAVVARMLGVAEQLDAANAAARQIVGPERRTPPSVAAATQLLLVSGRLDDMSPCPHLDPTAVSWWAPHAPSLVACRDCHDEASTNRGDRCDLCRRATRRLRNVLHLIPAPPPVRIDRHHVGARPPVIADFRLCEACRAHSPARPQRKRKRR